MPKIVTLACLKRLKPSITLTLDDVAMILFDQIVEVLRRSQRRVLGQQPVALHVAHRPVRRRVAVRRDLFWSDDFTVEAAAIGQSIDVSARTHGRLAFAKREE